jgi:hypothetical protein
MEECYSGSDNGGGGRVAATALKVTQELVGLGRPCRLQRASWGR